MIEAAELIEDTADPARELDTFSGDAGLLSLGPAASSEQLAKTIARMRKPRLRYIPVPREQGSIDRRPLVVHGRSRNVDVAVHPDCDAGTEVS